MTDTPGGGDHGHAREREPERGHDRPHDPDVQDSVEAILDDELGGLADVVDTRLRHIVDRVVDAATDAHRRHITALDAECERLRRELARRDATLDKLHRALYATEEPDGLGPGETPTWRASHPAHDTPTPEEGAGAHPATAGIHARGLDTDDAFARFVREGPDIFEETYPSRDRAHALLAHLPEVAEAVDRDGDAYLRVDTRRAKRFFADVVDLDLRSTQVKRVFEEIEALGAAADSPAAPRLEKTDDGKLELLVRATDAHPREPVVDRDPVLA